MAALAQPQALHTYLSTHRGDNMDYGLNPQQKKAILDSSLANVKSEIFHLLLRSNIDPDVFDVNNYTIADVLIGEQQRLETLLNSVELIERKLADTE